MPGGDRTGPAGMGPMTGRAAGYCAGNPVPGYANPYGGRAGRGPGWGRGRFFRWYQPVPGFRGVYPGPYPYCDLYPEEWEKEALQSQIQVFENQIKVLKKRIEGLEAEGPEAKEEG